MDAERMAANGYFPNETMNEQGSSTPKNSRWMKRLSKLTEVVEVDSPVDETVITPVRASPVCRLVTNNPSIWSLRKIKKIEEQQHHIQRPDSGFKIKILGQLEALDQGISMFRSKANPDGRNSPPKRMSRGLLECLHSPSYATPVALDPNKDKGTPLYGVKTIQMTIEKGSQESAKLVAHSPHKWTSPHPRVSHSGSQGGMLSNRKYLEQNSHRESMSQSPFNTSHSQQFSQEMPSLLSSEEGSQVMHKDNSSGQSSQIASKMSIFQSQQSDSFSIDTKRSNMTRENLKKLEGELRDKQMALMREKGAKITLIKELEAKTQQIDQMEKEIAFEIESLMFQKAEIEGKLSLKDHSCCKARTIEDGYRREIEEKERFIQLMRQHLQYSEERRMNTLQVLQTLKGNYQVFCRIKRLENAEQKIAFQHSACPQELSFQDGSKPSPTYFIFDGIFPEASSTKEILERLAPEIMSVLDGKNISLINIGTQNSGRPETLLGTFPLNPDKSFKQSFPETWGLVQLVLELLVNECIQRNIATLSLSGRDIELYLSCLDLTDERLGDLLGPKDKEEEVQILVSKGKVVLPDVVKKRITSMREALDTIRQSSERRQTEATAYNARSSRSHSIYRIAIHRRATGEQLGLLNIIDMAGSEKNSLDTQDTDSKKALAAINNDKLKKIQKEANFINKSLTTLGRIIRMIKQQRSMGIKDLCIPYRESKLTRMLQDCIGGEAQTLMIVNINPSAKCVGQTKETLNFSSVACV